jgi:thiosulfate reductase cytochrome b subunit
MVTDDLPEPPDEPEAESAPLAAIADAPPPDALVAAPIDAPSPSPAREVIYRHTVAVRVTHWINLFCISLLLMSGLQIFNAHPRLYWGQYGADADPAFIEMVAMGTEDHPKGVTRIAGHAFDTTGFLGVSRDSDHVLTPRGFPRWATWPSVQNLAAGRRWHFFLAWLFVINGAAYLGFGLRNRHFSRDLAPSPAQIRPRAVLQSIWDHMRLKHPHGEEAKRYNVLQKLTYLIVIFVLLPLMLLTGLTMSPGIDSVLPGLLDLFGGRQSARTIHFISANLIVLFVIVHVVEVFIAGAVNEIRSMITGSYVLPEPAQ